MEENATLIANASDEYYLYIRDDNTYFVKYSLGFYEKYAKILPEFNIYTGQKLYEELSKEDFLDFLANTIQYWGENCLTDPKYKNLLTEEKIS